MLAYLFWHRPQHDVETDAYEDYLAGFHEALAAAAVEGFRGSTTFCVEGADWMGARGARLYEDWYLLDGSRALDPLNEAAVTGVRKGPHDTAARAVRGGVGGLYRLRSGEPGVAEASFAVWLSKPPGTGYGELYALLEPWTERAETSLWRRQMVLGPAPEFCLLASEELRLPSGLDPVVVRRSRVWPGSGDHTTRSS